MLAEQHNAIFATIKGEQGSVTVFGDRDKSDADEGLSTQIFVGQTRINIAYWRLMKSGTALVTSIEDGQRLGGDPIDALADLVSELGGRQCLGVAVDTGTGDLLITFSGDVLLRAFRFRRLFEDWEVRLPDGEAYWSNMVSLHP